MQSKVTLNRRGNITIPARMREAFGLKPDDELIIEDTEQGLLLRPAVAVPIEFYTDDRIAEFERDDAAIAEKLDRGNPGKPAKSPKPAGPTPPAERN